MKPERVISEQNEFGGRTLEYEYEPGDKGYEEGLIKVVFFYDTQNRLVKNEVYLDEKNSKFRGIRSLIEELYDDGTPKRQTFYYSEEEMRKTWRTHDIFEFERDGRLKRLESHYGDLIPDDQHFKQVTAEFDDEGKIRRVESIYRDILKDMYQVEKMVQEYSKDGKVTKTELYPTKESSRESGIIKSIEYYDEHGEAKERELHFADGRVEKEPCYIREIRIEMVEKDEDLTEEQGI